MERLKPTPESYGRKIEFLEQAVAEGAHKKQPTVKQLTEEGWVRMRNIGAVYNGSSEASLESLGQQYSLTRERVRQINRQFIRCLWNNCSEETRKKFPLESISQDKPRPIDFGIRMSQVHGGISLKIKEEIDKGVTDPRRIVDDLGLTLTQIARSRSVLKTWGVELPRVNNSYEEFLAKVKKSRSDRKLQELLDSLPAMSLAHYKNRPKEKPLLIALGKILVELGFGTRSVREVGETLKSQGIPVREILVGKQKRKGGKERNQNYWVIFARHRKRVIGGINAIAADGEDKNKALRKADIRLACGVWDKDRPLPTTYALQKYKQYADVGQLIRETTDLRWYGPGSKSKREVFLSDCPVPVLKYNKNYYYPLDRENEFRLFIEKRYKELVSK